MAYAYRIIPVCSLGIGHPPQGGYRSSSIIL